MPTAPPAIDHELHDRVVALVRDEGPLEIATLTRRARLSLGRPVDELTVRVLLDTANLLVERPDGRVAYLGDVLDGIVLTHRVRGSLRDRTDLWLGYAVQPFLTMAVVGPLPLVDGGEARLGETCDPVLVGPPGWLPPAEHGDLVGLHWQHGRLAVRVVDPDDLAGPAEEDAVRRVLGEHCRSETWDGPDEDWVRNALLVRALATARLEDPAFLSTPHAPLDQALYEPLEPDPRHRWRDAAAWRHDDSVSFAVTGMPIPLERELRRRAGRYGMTFDQFVVAVLGHLAWRTPFAEDVGSWEDWLPDETGGQSARVLSLHAVDADPDTAS